MTKAGHVAPCPTFAPVVRGRTTPGLKWLWDVPVRLAGVGDSSSADASGNHSIASSTDCLPHQGSGLRCLLRKSQSTPAAAPAARGSREEVPEWNGGVPSGCDRCGKGLSRRRGARLDAEASEDVLQVFPDGAGSDSELSRHLPVGVAEGDQPEQFLLPGSEAVGLAGAPPRLIRLGQVRPQQREQRTVTPVEVDRA